MKRSSRSFSGALLGMVITLTLAVVACDDNKPSAKQQPVAPVVPATVAASSQTPEIAPAPVKMPEMSVDAAHVQVGSDELLLGTPEFAIHLKNLLAKYPVSKPNAVVMNVARGIKMPQATAIIYAVFDAGAKSVEVHTSPRGMYPGKLVLSSDKALGKIVPCTYVGTVLKDLAAAYWHVRGGTARRYTKGMAGPDFTAMHEILSKEIDSCTSTVFYFTADDSLEWGHGYDMATSIAAQNPPYKIETYVLLRESVPAGRSVKTPQ